jgi:hypothetical protein
MDESSAEMEITGQQVINNEEVTKEEVAAHQDAPITPDVAEASATFIGRWNRLVSTTNWEKGRIITQWRESIIAEGCPATASSDETWARLVGSVTGQHVGRLRRTWQRFGATWEQYTGLYWSHFQAAIDWDDAEMWLEGAARESWSVSQMRGQRWDTMDEVARKTSPSGDEAVASELDEDFEPANEKPKAKEGLQNYEEAGSRPLPEGPDFGDEDSPAKEKSARNESGDAETGPKEKTVTLVKPFEDMPELTEDVHDAFDQMKLAILRHKALGWSDFSQASMLQVIESLKQLALAPSSEEAPF